MALATLTQLSRALGVTVPAVKKILAEAGYLEGKVPTAKAEADGVFEWRPLSAAFPEAGQFPLWDEDKVWDLAKATGQDANAGNGVWSCQSAGDTMAKAAGMVWDTGAKLAPDVEAALSWCQYEGIELLRAHQEQGRRAAGALAAAHVAPVLAYLRENRGSSKERAALTKFETALGWFQGGRG